MTTINILGLNVVFCDYPFLLENVKKSIIGKTKLTVSYANFHVCNLCVSDVELRRAVNNFDIVHSDGMLVYLTSRFMSAKSVSYKRISGTDFYGNLYESSGDYRVFLLGGLFDINEGAVKDRFSEKLKITGHKRLADNTVQVLTEINNSNSDILMVGLGTPFQEKWINENKNHLNVPVIMAVGSGLEFFAGFKKKAPLWMQKSGLEWLYRLFQEPRRLWKRYVLGIPVFLFYVLVQKVKFILKK